MAAESASFDCIDGLLRARHSCRGFQPKQVPRETIERLFSTAQTTASWCNTQPWQIVVTGGAETERFRSALVTHVGGHKPSPDLDHPVYQDCYLDRRRECGFALYESVGIARGDREGSARQAAQNFTFFGAPHVAIISAPKSLGSYGAIDCGGYVANFLLIAQSLGLASIPQAALAAHADFIHAYFNIADDRNVVCGISFGFEDTDHPANSFRTTRASLDDAVDFRF